MRFFKMNKVKHIFDYKPLKLAGFKIGGAL